MDLCCSVTVMTTISIMVLPILLFYTGPTYSWSLFILVNLLQRLDRQTAARLYQCCIWRAYYVHCSFQYWSLEVQQPCHLLSRIFHFHCCMLQPSVSQDLRSVWRFLLQSSVFIEQFFESLIFRKWIMSPLYLTIFINNRSVCKTLNSFLYTFCLQQ